MNLNTKPMSLGTDVSTLIPIFVKIFFEPLFRFSKQKSKVNYFPRQGHGGDLGPHAMTVVKIVVMVTRNFKACGPYLLKL